MPVEYPEIKVGLDDFVESLKDVLDDEINKPIFNFEVTPTEACNCCCSYCFEPTQLLQPTPARITRNSIKVIQALLDNHEFQAAFKGVNLTFWGGEPTLNVQNVMSYINAFGAKTNVYWHIYTNGTRQEELERIVTQFEKYRAVNRLSVQISYDGNPVHDLRRCFKNSDEPTSYYALATARRLVARGVRVSFKATITPPDFHLLPRAWDSYRDLCLEFNSQRKPNDYIQYCPTIDQAHDYDQDFSEDFKAALAEVCAKELEFFKKNKYYVMSWFGSFAHQCSRGRSMVCMNTVGTLYTCHGVQYFLGDGKRSNLQDELITSTLGIEPEQVVESILKKSASDDHNKYRKLPEECVNCIATHCALCNACSASLSEADSPEERWYDRSVQKHLCKYYKIFGAYDKALDCYQAGIRL